MLRATKSTCFPWRCALVTETSRELRINVVAAVWSAAYAYP